MIAQGRVLRLTCEECGARPAHFQFSGDTDMATDGLGACSDLTGSSLTLYSPAHSAQDADSDCRSARPGGVVEQVLPDGDESFASFRHRYRPATLEYICPWCEGGRMTVSQDLAPEEFIHQGGQIRCLGDITLDQGPTHS